MRKSYPTKLFVLAIILLAFIAGCAVTPGNFNEAKYKLSDTRLCRTWVSAVKSGDYSFASSVQNEASRRGLSTQDCQNLITKQNNSIVGGILAIGAAALIIKHGGGGGGHSGGYTDYDWDQFHGRYGGLVWACREVNTGRFAETENCRYKYKDDDRWPGK